MYCRLLKRPRSHNICLDVQDRIWAMTCRNSYFSALLTQDIQYLEPVPLAELSELPQAPAEIRRTILGSFSGSLFRHGQGAAIGL